MKLIDILITSKIIKKEDTDLYEYSLTILISYIFFSLLVFLGNLFTKNFITTLLFLIVFFSFRKYSGGLHLESRKICLLFSVFLTILVPYLAESFHLTSPLILVLQLVISFLLSLFPIIETPQKSVSTIEKKVYKQNSLLILLFIFLMSIVFTYFKMIKYSIVILFTLLVSLISVLLGFIKYK